MKNTVKTLCVAALVALLPISANAQQTPVGEWTGVLSTPGGALNLVIRIRANPDGSYFESFATVDVFFGALLVAPVALSFSNPSR